MDKRQGSRCRHGFAVRRAALVLALLGLSASSAAAQPPVVDVLVGPVQVSPATTEAGQRVTVSATIRRRASPKAPQLAEPVAVDIEFAVGQGPFAIERVTLKPDEARRVQAHWTAQPGQHVFVVRIRRVMTLQGQTPVDPQRDNDQRTSPTLVVRAPVPPVAGPPAPVPGGTPPAPPAPTPPVRPNVPVPPPALGTIAGRLTVPPELETLDARVVLEGRHGQAETRALPGGRRRGERPYRFDDLPPGTYRVTPEFVQRHGGQVLPRGRWDPRPTWITLDPARPRSRLQAQHFEFEPAGRAGAAAVEGRRATPSAPAEWTRAPGVVGRMSQAELDGVADMLNRKGTVLYSSHVFGWKDGTGMVQPVSLGHHRGLLTLRDRRHLQRLLGAYHDDGAGNLVYFGRLRDGGAYGVTAPSSRGPGLSVVDGNGDGVIEAALGDTLDGRFWLLASPDAAFMFRCLGTPTPPGVSASDQFGRCARRGNGGGGGSGGAGAGGFSDPFGWLNGKPECASKPGEGIASTPQLDTVTTDDGSVYQYARTEHSDGSVTESETVARPDGTWEQHTITRDGHGRLIRESHDYVHADGHRTGTHRIVEYTGDGGYYTETLVTMRRDETRNRRTTEGCAVAECGLPRPGGSEPVQMHKRARQRSGYAGRPPTGEPGQPAPFEDPRCRMNPQSPWTSWLDGTKGCGAVDLITCVQRHGSPALDLLTDGHCRVGEGRAGGREVVCSGDPEMKDCLAKGGSPRECMSRRGSGAGEGGRVGIAGPGACPNDAPGCATTPKADSAYLITTAMGAFVATICQGTGGAGFCGDPTPELRRQSH